MGLFSKKKEDTLHHMHPIVHQQLVAQSFNHVRKDVQTIYDWIRYLHNQNKAQQDIIHHLSSQIQSSHLQKDASDQKTQAHVQDLRSRIFDIEKKVSHVQANQPQAPSPSADVVQKFSEIMDRMQVKQAQLPSSPMTTSLQERVIRKVQQNSKEYIKNVMAKLISKYARISGLQLREIVVDEQALCSRSSFYRLLGELEQSGQVGVDSHGKEKIYSVSSDDIIDPIRNV